MKRPTTLLCRVLLDEELQTNVVVERDVREIERRFEHEGMSFLTIALPSLDDALLQGLTKGFLTPSMFHGFKPCKRGGMLPALLSGFFRNVFNEDGLLKETPCIRSIRAIRQVTRLFKKVELPCSAARIQRAYERYVSNDKNISGVVSCGYVDAFVRRIASYLWADLEGLSGALYCSPGVFGTGATAERLAYNQRHSIKQWPKRGDESFPASYHTVATEGDSDTLLGLEFLEEASEQPVRVVQVPKTLKTPRTISVEPSYMMLRQQSIAKPIMALLEAGCLGFRSIRFSDQTVNRELAREGSVDGCLSTIDLSDASDLVSLDAVKSIFETCPSFLQYLLDSRSSRALLPDNSELTLKKFASMGSALCFPIEAMVFFTIALASMIHQSGRSPSRKLLAQLTAKIAVYGDDIIVPTETADGVMDWLEAFGLRVNHDKSFTKGFFRESCGGDYYKGQDITPAYVRQWTDSVNTRNPQHVEACVSLSNQFYLKGLWNASQYIRDVVDSRLGALPRTRHPVGGLTWASVLFDTKLRYNPASCGYSVRTLSTRARRRRDPVLDIRGGLLVAFGPQAITSRCSDLPRIAREYFVAQQSYKAGLYPGYAVEALPEAIGSKPTTDVGSVSVNVCAEASVEDGGVGTPERSGVHPYPLYSSPRDFFVQRESEPSSWEEWLSHRQMEWTRPPLPRDLSTSVRPRALDMKRVKVSVPKTGLNWL